MWIYDQSWNSRTRNVTSWHKTVKVRNYFSLFLSSFPYCLFLSVIRLDQLHILYSVNDKLSHVLLTFHLYHPNVGSLPHSPTRFDCPSSSLLISWTITILKINLSLYLMKQHAMKTYWGMKVWLHLILTSGLASRPGLFTPVETAPGTHWIEGWMGSRTGLNKIPSLPLPGIEPPSSSSWLSHYTYRAKWRN
jgi:hypothetical protein